MKNRNGETGKNGEAARRRPGGEVERRDLRASKMAGDSSRDDLFAVPGEGLPALFQIKTHEEWHKQLQDLESLAKERGWDNEEAGLKESAERAEQLMPPVAAGDEIKRNAGGRFVKGGKGGPGRPKGQSDREADTSDDGGPVDRGDMLIEAICLGPDGRHVVDWVEKHWDELGHCRRMH